MRKLPLIIALFIFLILSGCVQQQESNGATANEPGVQDETTQQAAIINGFEVYKFIRTCASCDSIADCEDEKAFCESNGLAVSLVKGTGHSMTLYPEKAVTCNYYCASQEQLEKQKETSPNANYSTCENEPAGDPIFTGLVGINKDMVDLKFHIILLKEEGRTLEFVSAVGKEGFSGTMQITQEGDLTDAGYWVFLDRLKNLEAGKQAQKGVIEITYRENGVEKIHKITCTYPRT
ncbi:MAG: hypothetical protein WC634_03070 [archaeon]